MPPPRLPQTRLNRAALFAFGTTVAAGMFGAGCGGESTRDPEASGGAGGVSGAGGYAAMGGIYGLPGFDAGSGGWSTGGAGGWIDAGTAGVYGAPPEDATAGGSGGAVDSGTSEDDGSTAGAAGLNGTPPDDAG